VRILIVDDVAVNRLVLSEQVAGWGMRASAVESAAAGRGKLVEAARDGDPFRLALVDYQMPDEDGESFANSIRDTQTAGRLGLVMVTSSGQRGEADRFARAGFSAYFVKPVRSAMLMEGLAAVRRVVEAGSVLPEIITRHTLAERHARLTPSHAVLVAVGSHGGAVRPYPHGLADAGHRRIRGDGCHPPRRGYRAAQSDCRADRDRDARGSRTMSRRRDGRLRL
jgi:CheY-like chemotaxis protein